MTNTRDIALLLSQQRTTKQDAVPIYKGEIVEMRNGAGDDSIYVDNRPLHIWVRLWSAQGSVVPVYNERVASVAGLPVLVSRRPGTVHELEVIGLDVETLQSQDDPNTGLVNPFHAAAHEWPDAGPGIDPLTVYPRSWSQLKTYPQNPLSTSVDVSPLRHQTASTITIFNGGTEALAADIAALGANEAQLVLIYLDTTTNALASANGAVGTIADGWTLAEPTIPTNDAYLSAVVRIYNGQTEIDEFDIRDRRFFLNPVPGTISNVHWCNVWVVADCGGDFTTVVDAVADARVVNGDTLLIMPDTYAGWATSKTLSYAALTPYNQADHSGDVIINTGVIINNNPGGTQTFYGIEFQATVRLDYDQNAYFLSCGLEGSDAIESGVNSTGAGLTVLDHCYVGDAIVATAGSGWDLELHDTDVDGAITLDQDLILWSHVQVAGAMTITGSITRVDAPHIEHAAWGINTLVVAQEGAEYTTVAAAVAALGANETAIITVDTWTCDNQTLAANENMVGVDKDQCILSTTTVTRCINLGSSGAEPYLANITVSNTYNNAAAITAVHTTEDCELRDVYAIADNANGGAAAHAYGYEIDNTGTYNVKMVDCEAYATQSGGAPPNAYGIYIAAAGAAGPTVEVHGGRYYGSAGADLYVGTNATVKLFGPVLVNGSISGAGTVEGFWYDLSGNFHSCPGGGDIDMEALGNRIDLDADNDTSIRASADDTITIEVAGTDTTTIDAAGITQIAGDDVYPNANEAGLQERFDAFTSWSEHFDVAALPAGWNWANDAAGPFAGAGAPGTVDFATYGSIFRAGDNANVQAFCYRAVVATYYSASFVCRMLPWVAAANEVGIRLDDSTDPANNYVEVLIDYVAGAGQRIITQFNNGAGETSTTCLTNQPVSMFFNLSIFTSGVAGNWSALAYTGIDIPNSYLANAGAGKTWTPDRIGIYIKSGSASNRYYIADAATGSMCTF